RRDPAGQRARAPRRRGTNDGGDPPNRAPECPRGDLRSLLPISLGGRRPDPSSPVHGRFVLLLRPQPSVLLRVPLFPSAVPRPGGDVQRAIPRTRLARPSCSLGEPSSGGLRSPPQPVFRAGRADFPPTRA